MKDYQRNFIDFLKNTGALKLGDFKLKSQRLSPWFVNIGDFDTGSSVKKLGEAYAETFVSYGMQSDILYGIPEKGKSLVTATAIALSEKGIDLPFFSTRKDAKGYGEATDLSQEDLARKVVIGRIPENGQRIGQLDDVLTDGGAKYDARELLENLGDFKYPILAIAVDRQEVGRDGRNAIQEYEKATGTKVISIVNASEVYHHLRELGEVSDNDLDRMVNYLRVYGTDEAIKSVGKLEQKIVMNDKSVIPACDVSTIEEFEELARQTNVEGVGALKIGFELSLTYGLPRVVETARKHTSVPIIYDHQKAGTDIPDTAEGFMRTMENAGVDSVILFPQSGPETERAWIYRALNHGLKVIVGGRMTHPAYPVSEGGFITDEGTFEMYRIAARTGVSDFVVPGNKPEIIKKVKEVVESEGCSKPVFYAPGFIAQGGKISDAAKETGNRFHGIVGRGIYRASDMRQAAIEHASQLY